MDTKHKRLIVIYKPQSTSRQSFECFYKRIEYLYADRFDILRIDKTVDGKPICIDILLKILEDFDNTTFLALPYIEDVGETQLVLDDFYDSISSIIKTPIITINSLNEEKELYEHYYLAEIDEIVSNLRKNLLLLETKIETIVSQ